MHVKKLLENAQAELTISVPPSDYERLLESAAKRISQRTAIAGFRPGNAPYFVVAKEVGEMNILREALESVIQKSFYEAVTAEKLETIGMPKIDIEKLAPGNDIVYKATVSLLPSVDLADLDTITTEWKVKTIGETDIMEAVESLRGLQAAETIKDGVAGVADKVVVDMDMLVDLVPIDGGQAKDYEVYLGEEHYIPGFNKALIGSKAGEEKKFTLQFPESHYQKMLAGKNVDFVVKIKVVFERKLPELNDGFAQKLGQPTVTKLKELVKKNLESEAEQKAEARWEIGILDALIEKSKFDRIPDILIDAERQKMFYELKRDLERNGVSIEQYLSDIKKDEKELFKEFRDQAEKRAKAALVSREIARRQGLSPTHEEIDTEVDHLKKVYKENSEYVENLKKPEVRDTIATMLQNRKVMAYLKAKKLGKELHKNEHLIDACEDHDHQTM